MFNLKAFGPRLVIPASFSDCLSYSQQVMWLMEHKSNILTAGDNITLTENADGTITVSSQQAETHTYSITKTIDVEQLYPYGTITKYIYKLVDETGAELGEPIEVPMDTYTISKTGYTDGTETGYDYELFKNGYQKRGETIRVPNATQGGLYTAGGSFLGTDRSEYATEYPELQLIDVNMKFLSGNPFSPTETPLESAGGGCYCAIAFDNKASEPRRSMIYRPVVEGFFADYNVFDCYGRTESAVQDVRQFGVEYVFNGLLPIPYAGGTESRYLTYIEMSDGTLSYDRILFSQDTTNNVTKVSVYHVYPSPVTLSAEGMTGLTIFS